MKLATVFLLAAPIFWASTAVEMTQANTNLDAAMAARAKQPTVTLFDYLR